MNREICTQEQCTGCAACRDACPKQCIMMRKDSLDAVYPTIDESKCVDCGLCEKTCPNNRTIEYRHPQKVFAAWSKDDKVRRTSASGGIACELYKYWIKNEGVATGVVYNREEGCHFVLIEKEEDIQPTQNSKYTFSDTYGIYKVVKEKLNTGIPVLFIGVPCQVAGLYGFLKKDYDNLTTVDIICHGMPPAAYLQKHVEVIEQRVDERTSTLYFRDPAFRTDTFTFTLRNVSNKVFYKKKVLSNDNFQLGYHRALIYRENCYHCKYARRERISDLTISDFSGLGTILPVKYRVSKTSCILLNSKKGAELLKKVSDMVVFDERPQDEAFNVEKQLKAPSIKHPRRILFEEYYRKSRDFEAAANIALESEKIKAKRQRLKSDIKSFVKLFIPQGFITNIKNVLNK